MRPVGGLLGRWSACGGSLEGGRDEFDEFCLSCASSSRTRCSSSVIRASNDASICRMSSSRSRHPEHCGSADTPLSSDYPRSVPHARNGAVNGYRERTNETREWIHESQCRQVQVARVSLAYDAVFPPGPRRPGNLRAVLG